MSVLVIAVVIGAVAAVAFVAATVFNGEPPSRVGPAEGVETVRLSGEVLMTHANGLQHAVTAPVTARLGRQLLASGVVDEDNGFSMEIPADVRGEIEVRLGMHDGSGSLVQADGGDLHAVLYYNPVNNYFA